MRGGPSEPRLSLVLSARARRRGAGPLDLLEEPAWPLPRQRPPAAPVRDGRPALHREGLVGGDGFAVDASLIAADANKQRSLPSSEWKTADIGRGRLPGRARVSRDAGRCRVWRGERQHAEVHLPVDPAAHWTGAHKGHAFFAYATNYLIDLDHAIIVDVEATRAIRQAEVGAARTMIERTEERFGLYPERLAADSAYGSAEMLGWLVHEHGIEPHIPVFDKSARTDGTFSREDFAYDHEGDVYRLPGRQDADLQRARW